MTSKILKASDFGKRIKKKGDSFLAKVRENIRSANDPDNFGGGRFSSTSNLTSWPCVGPCLDDAGNPVWINRVDFNPTPEQMSRYVNETTRGKVESDPIMYSDNDDKIVAAYARALASGENMPYKASRWVDRHGGIHSKVPVISDYRSTVTSKEGIAADGKFYDEPDRWDVANPYKRQATKPRPIPLKRGENSWAIAIERPSDVSHARPLSSSRLDNRYAPRYEGDTDTRFMTHAKANLNKKAVAPLKEQMDAELKELDPEVLTAKIEELQEQIAALKRQRAGSRGKYTRAETKWKRKIESTPRPYPDVGWDPVDDKVFNKTFPR